jgi:hypothetical protein
VPWKKISRHRNRSPKIFTVLLIAAKEQQQQQQQQQQ